MEEYQPLYYSPDHPQIFLMGLMGSLVQNRNGCLVPLQIIGLHDFRLEHFIKGLEQFYGRFEPTVYRTFACLESQVSELLDLTLERKVVFIFLKEDFAQ